MGISSKINSLEKWKIFFSFVYHLFTQLFTRDTRDIIEKPLQFMKYSHKIQTGLLFTFSLLIGTHLMGQDLEYVHPKPVGSYFENVAIVPGTTTVFAIAENSCNILKSSDLGMSWEITCQTPGPQAFDGFDDIFFLNDTLGFLVSSYEVYRTTDGGNQWEMAFDSVRCNLFDFDMNENGIGIGVVNSGKIFITEDYGATWTAKRIRDVSFTSVSVLENDDIYLGARDGTWFSSDTAKTGFVFNLPADGAIDFFDTLQGIAISDEAVWYTENSGDNWISVVELRPFSKALTLHEDGKVLVSDGRFLKRSTDYGLTFEEVLDLSEFLDTGDYNLSIEITGLTSQGDTVIAVGRYGALLRSTDFGLSWEMISRHETTNDMFDLLVKDGNMLAVGHTENLLSNDNGTTVTRQKTPDFFMVFLDEFEDGTLISISRRGQAYISTDGGETWMEQGSLDIPPSGRIRNGKILNDQSIVIVGNDGLVAKSIDFGVSWQVQTGPFNDPAHDLYSLDFLDEQLGVIGGTLNRIYLTTDGGETWNERSIVSEGQRRTIITLKLKSDNELIAYRTHGAFQSSDAGLTYEESNTDFHEVVTFNEDGKGVWQAFSNIYVTTDFGDNWFLLSHELASVFTRARIFDNDVWLVGQNGLIWKGTDVFQTVSTFGPNFEESEFNIFPNPAHDELVLATGWSDNSPYIVQIFDSNGRVMWQEERQASQGNIKMSLDLPAGLYYLSLSTSQGQHIASEKLVIYR